MVKFKDHEWFNDYGDRIQNPPKYFEKIKYNKEHGIQPTGGKEALDRAIDRTLENQLQREHSDIEAHDKGFNNYDDYRGSTTSEERMNEYDDFSDW